MQSGGQEGQTGNVPRIKKACLVVALCGNVGVNGGGKMSERSRRTSHPPARSLGPKSTTLTSCKMMGLSPMHRDDDGIPRAGESETTHSLLPSTRGHETDTVHHAIINGYRHLMVEKGIGKALEHVEVIHDKAD